MTKEQAQEEFEADYEGNELFDGLPSDVYRDPVPRLSGRHQQAD